MSPKRIQLRRTKGWRKPAGAVVVTRPTKWGNPFVVTPFMGGWSVDHAGEHHGVLETESAARQLAVELLSYGIHPAAPKDSLPEYPLIADMERELAGHDLACWCPLSQPCHADVLLELANS